MPPTIVGFSPTRMPEVDAARNFRRSIFMIDAFNVLRPLLISFFNQTGLVRLRRANRKHKYGGDQCR